ncbi:MAG: ThuA domain-containing protein [Pseudomonadota bacterium]
MFEDRGVATTVTTDILDAVARIERGDAGCLTVNALRWTMQTGDKYKPYRARWAFEMPAAARATLTRFVAGGGRLLGVHTASICFDDWPGWRDVLGAWWQWGSSFHPPLGPVEAWPVTEPHPITQGVSGFVVDDEVYHGLDVAADAVPLLYGRAEDAGTVQPLLWAREHGRGRSVYSALGHDADSMREPMHRRLLGQSIDWLLADVPPA